jgi:uncharacterized protein (UPF0218 family)
MDIKQKLTDIKNHAKKHVPEITYITATAAVIATTVYAALKNERALADVRARIAVGEEDMQVLADGGRLEFKRDGEMLVVTNYPANEE